MEPSAIGHGMVLGGRAKRQRTGVKREVVPMRDISKMTGDVLKCLRFAYDTPKLKK